MKPVLYRYKDTESVIKVMDGYTPGDGWEPLYSQDQISSAVNAALKATAPDEQVKELEAELAAAEIAIAEYRQQCLDNAAEIARLRSESEERLQNCAALVAEVERLRAAPATAPEQCWCQTCRPITQADNRMVLCPDCGNKRCPKATDHRNACTGSNEPGQPGSSYPTVPATAPEHLDPADLCDVCKEPVRYGSRHHACGEAMLRAKANAAPATAPAQPEIVDLLAEMYELILANKVVLAEKSGGVWTWPDRAIEAVRKHRSGPARAQADHKKSV